MQYRQFQSGYTILADNNRMLKPFYLKSLEDYMLPWCSGHHPWDMQSLLDIQYMKNTCHEIFQRHTYKR